jgi:hypothetical protein
VISSARQSIQADAKTPADQGAVHLIDNIPLQETSPTQAAEAIYETISPRIGQSDAGELYKSLTGRAKQLANEEKTALYRDLVDKTVKSNYQIPEKEFGQLTNMLDEQISALKALVFRSPQQERVLARLSALRDSFDRPVASIDLTDGQNISIADRLFETDVPSLAKFWEVRKSLGQAINWRSNLPADKQLKSVYHQFNELLERNMKRAGLLEDYNVANQTYIDRFLPLESGINGKVRFMNPMEAGQRLNLASLDALANYLPLADINPLRRFALEKTVGHPPTGELSPRSIQRIENARRYMTPVEQAQFDALRNMPLLRAQTSMEQLGIIERYLAAHRADLSPDVVRSLERVSDELRANADLPVEYITGRARIEAIERAAKETHAKELAQYKKDLIELRRESRSAKKKTAQEISHINQQIKEKNAQINELESTVKQSGRDRAKLQRSLIYTMLERDTGTQLMDKMSSLKGVRAVKEMLGDSPAAQKIFEELKLAKAREIMSDAGSVNGIAKLWRNEASNDLMKELLPSGQFKKAQEIAELAQKEQDKFRYWLNTSNTYVQQSTQNTLKEAFNGILQLSQIPKIGHYALAPLGRVIFRLIFRRKLAEAMTDPEVIKNVTKWMQGVKNAPMTPATGKLAESAAKSIVEYTGSQKKSSPTKESAPKRGIPSS